jgi:hypothetical protein
MDLDTQQESLQGHVNSHPSLDTGSSTLSTWLHPVTRFRDQLPLIAYILIYGN